MNKMMILVSVTGVWFLATGALGVYLARKDKPYKVVITSIHGFFSLFIIGGTISSISQLQLITDSKLFLSISLYLLGIAACIKIISGIFIVSIRKNNRKAVLIHKIGTYLIIISLISGIIFSGLKI